MFASAMRRLKFPLLMLLLLAPVASSQAQAQSSVSNCHPFSVGRSDFRLRISQVKRASDMRCSLVRRLIRGTYTGGGYRQTYPYHTPSGVGYGEPIHWFHGGWRCGTGAGGIACRNATRPIFNVIDIGAPKMQAITAATRFTGTRVQIDRPGHSGYVNCGNPPNWSGNKRVRWKLYE